MYTSVATTLGANIEAQNGKNADYVEALGKQVFIRTLLTNCL